jgi:hypothetical protein
MAAGRPFRWRPAIAVKLSLMELKSGWRLVVLIDCAAGGKAGRGIALVGRLNPEATGYIHSGIQ